MKEEPEKGTYMCPEVPNRTLNIYNYLNKEGYLDRMQRILIEDELTPELFTFLEKKILPLNHSAEYIKEIK